MYFSLLFYYGNMSFTYETRSFEVKNSMDTLYIWLLSGHIIKKQWDQ